MFLRTALCVLLSISLLMQIQQLLSAAPVQNKPSQARPVKAAPTAKPVVSAPVAQPGPQFIITPLTPAQNVGLSLPEKQFQMEVYLEQGRLALDANKLADAIAICRLALGLDLFEARLQSILGETYLMLDNPEQAVNALRKSTGSLQDKRLLSDALTGLGWVRFEAQKPAEAEAFWQEAIEVDGLSGRPRAAMALAAIRSGNPQQAIEYGRQASIIEPDWPGAWSVYGITLYLSGDLETAQQVQEHALELFPKNPAAMNNLAFTLLEKGNAETALTLWRQAVEINTFDPDIRAGLALASWQLGDDRSARAWYRHAATQDQTYLEPGRLAATNYWSQYAIDIAHAIMASINASHNEVPATTE